MLQLGVIKVHLVALDHRINTVHVLSGWIVHSFF